MNAKVRELLALASGLSAEELGHREDLEPIRKTVVLLKVVEDAVENARLEETIETCERVADQAAMQLKSRREARGT